MGRFSQKLDNLSMRRPGFICAQCAGSRERAISEPVKGPEPLARRRARQGRLPATAINTAVDKNVWSCPSRVASANAITLDCVAEQPCLVSAADALGCPSPAILRNILPSGARSAMNSRCHDTIEQRARRSPPASETQADIRNFTDVTPVIMMGEALPR